MSRNRLKQLSSMKIDNRTAEDIENRIKELSLAYVPEWHFDRENPDIGSTLGIIFAGQMAANIDRFNQVIEKYHMEFVNMLDISLLPAKPSCAVVLLDLIQDTIPGVGVLKGTKLLAAEDGEEPLIFETAHNVYVTNARLTNAFMTDVKTGKVLPLLGHFTRPEILKLTEAVEESETVEEPEETRLTPFVLFADEREGIEQNALLLYHQAALDVVGSDIYIRIIGNKKLTEKIKEEKFVFYYAAQDGLIPVEEVSVEENGETVVLRKQQQDKKQTIDEKEYSLLVLKAEEPIRESWRVQDILLSSTGADVPAEFVNNGATDFDVDSFDLFGTTLALFSECFIGQDSYFSKAGAFIKMSFDVSYFENSVSYTIQQEQDELKVIKRKPKTIWTDTAADAFAEEISLEYFNGIGWKKLPCMQEYRGMFATEQKGRYEISFFCPADWEQAATGAYIGRCIRVQLLKSDNCYVRPCVHHYPHLDNLRISYTYEKNEVRPERAKAIFGTAETDLSKKVMEAEGYQAFVSGEYEEDALYLGFGQKMEDGPISILFQLEDGVRYDSVECRFEYSTTAGFKQLKVLDHTMNMSRSGTVLFMPPADMGRMTFEGKRAYWIRICSLKKGEKDVAAMPPKVTAISLNAAEVYNIETRQEEDCYLAEVSANMAFPLAASNILDVDLWVNEKGRHTAEEMSRLSKEMPDRVRIERDMLGNISSFYVKWEETEQFGEGGEKRQYILDRMNQTLLFGDGIHTEIPRVLDDVAFKLVVRCCSGQRGNIGENQIREPLENLLFVDNIRNPKPAFGGSNIESMESALERGANILSARRRLVSEKDYEREILTYSDNIDKVSSVLGRNACGEPDENAVTFVLLLKDFASGSYSFHNMAGNLKKHLQQQCELTIAPEELHIIEPVFVSVYVDVWMKIQDLDDGFEVQNMLQECLENYLYPIGDEQGEGWQIGSMPQKAQIRMRLNALRSKATVKKLAATAVYTDESGRHEKDLDELEITPFMVCRSGRHRIHMMLAD